MLEFHCTWCCNLDDCNLNLQHCGNLMSCTCVLYFISSLTNFNFFLGDKLPWLQVMHKFLLSLWVIKSLKCASSPTFFNTQLLISHFSFLWFCYWSVLLTYNNLIIGSPWNSEFSYKMCSLHLFLGFQRGGVPSLAHYQKTACASSFPLSFMKTRGSLSFS
jgi:hypothetical protein